MNYNTLGILLRKTCTAECDICSVECSPYCEEELDVEYVKKFIDSCKDTTIKKISFSGGEPFIKYKELVELVQYTCDMGFDVRLVTNGYWATTYDIAFERMLELKKCGLSMINISYDLHHAKFISQNNINHIIRACNMVELQCMVAAVKLKNEKIGKLIDEFDEDMGGIKFLVAPCEPVGNASNNYDIDNFQRNVKNEKLICPYDGVITLRYDGAILPCCSHYAFNSKLIVGNYRDMTMDKVLNNIRNNGLLYILRNYGLDPFVKMKKDLKIKNQKYLSSPCEVCKELFGEDILWCLDDVKKFLNKISTENQVR